MSNNKDAAKHRNNQIAGAALTLGMTGYGAHAGVQTYQNQAKNLFAQKLKDNLAAKVQGSAAYDPGLRPTTNTLKKFTNAQRLKGGLKYGAAGLLAGGTIAGVANYTRPAGNKYLQKTAELLGILDV